MGCADPDRGPTSPWMPPSWTHPAYRLSLLQHTAQYCHLTSVLSPPCMCPTVWSGWCSLSACGCQQQHTTSTHPPVTSTFGGHLILSTQTIHFLCSHHHSFKSTKELAGDCGLAEEQRVCPPQQQSREPAGPQQQLSTTANSSSFCHTSQTFNTPFWGRKAIVTSPAQETESRAGAAAGRGQYGVSVSPASSAEDRWGFTRAAHLPVT